MKDYPRIAVVICGTGISASGTADAFALPTAITFAVRALPRENRRCHPS